jgi:oxygen-independent coproporphyrinogen III oxidase
MSAVFDKYSTRAVPRYTSYPTAPHFAGDFRENRYRDWLARLNPKEPISLYLHVPFCQQMCWYCGCRMKLAARYQVLSDYVGRLIDEIDLVAEALPARMPVAHLHFGGGTPTALAPRDLAVVVEHLSARFAFTSDAERAIESDPRTLSEAMMECIGALRFNRASFGVQEFDTDVQQAINRIQPPDMVARACEGLRAVGVANVNFDLIYGLPYQTVASLRRTVEQCVAMQPDRIALFGYAHVPWVAKNQRMIQQTALPDARARAAQAQQAADALVAVGYARIGIDHFALPSDALSLAAQTGKLRRNFQGYTSDPTRTLIGIGATAIGRTPAGYVQNCAETGAWSRAVAGGRLPIARGHEMVGQDALRAHVIERIMCEGAVDLEAAGLAFGEDETWCSAERAALAELEEDGLLLNQKGQLRLTQQGVPLARIVAATFDQYLKSAPTRHSVAV